MNIQKPTLAEQIQRCQNGYTAFPSYLPSVILNLAEMPVQEYLAVLPDRQQMRFFDLTGAWYKGCTYQQAALYIQELTTPAWAEEAMRILAEPMIRYDDLHNEAKLPPPARKPEVRSRPRRGEKVPLAERLQFAAIRECEAPYLHIYRMYVDSYCYNLDIIMGSLAYADTLDVVLAPWLEKYETPPTLTRFIADSRELPAKDRTQLLYQLLVRPFAEMQEEKERRERKCTSLPF